MRTSHSQGVQRGLLGSSRVDLRVDIAAMVAAAEAEIVERDLTSIDELVVEDSFEQVSPNSGS